ncbi:hypothetical protein CB1_060782029 [Camelus ferus]|nr:hypothetical protein CB1_060782029 [Camelus ferus]
MSNTIANEKRTRIKSEKKCLSLELRAATSQEASFPSPGPGPSRSHGIFHVTDFQRSGIREGRETDAVLQIPSTSDMLLYFTSHNQTQKHVKGIVEKEAILQREDVPEGEGTPHPTSEAWCPHSGAMGDPCCEGPSVSLLQAPLQPWLFPRRHSARHVPVMPSWTWLPGILIQILLEALWGKDLLIVRTSSVEDQVKAFAEPRNPEASETPTLTREDSLFDSGKLELTADELASPCQEGNTPESPARTGAGKAKRAPALSYEATLLTPDVEAGHPGNETFPFVNYEDMLEEKAHDVQGTPCGVAYTLENKLQNSEDGEPECGGVKRKSMFLRRRGKANVFKFLEINCTESILNQQVFMLLAGRGRMRFDRERPSQVQPPSGSTEQQTLRHFVELEPLEQDTAYLHTVMGRCQRRRTGAAACLSTAVCFD